MVFNAVLINHSGIPFLAKLSIMTTFNFENSHLQKFIVSHGCIPEWSVANQGSDSLLVGQIILL